MLSDINYTFFTEADNYMALGAMFTAAMAFFGYRLAQNKFKVDKEKSDREGVSVVFKDIICDKNRLEIQFKIYNRSGVDLLIEDVALNSYPNHGWEVSIFNNEALYANPSAEIVSFLWVYDSISNHKRLTDMAYLTDTEKNFPKGEFLKHPVVKPNEHLFLKATFSRRENKDQEMNIGKLKAKLCYEGAQPRNYSLEIPNSQKLQEILERQKQIDVEQAR